MKIIKTIVIAICCLCAAPLTAQDTKKAGKAVVSIITYDSKGSVLKSGHGFFISADGTALSDFDTFNGAHKAVVIDAEGKKHDVERIHGASDLYNLVKFSTSAKKTAFLPMAASPAAKGSSAVIVNYAVDGKGKHLVTKITDVTNFSGKAYYTLGNTGQQTISLPLINTAGAVLGLTQKGARKADNTLYAIDASLADSMYISLKSFADKNLSAIHIAKAIPPTEAAAASYLYMLLKSSRDTLALQNAVNDFVATYPKNANGYAGRGQLRLMHRDYKAAQEDFQKAISLSDTKHDIHYTYSKLAYDIALETAQNPIPGWDFATALSEADAAYAQSPEPLYAVQQANSLYALMRYAEAKDKYKEAADKMNAAEYYLYAAQAQDAAKGDLSEAVALINAGLAKFPQPYSSAAAPFLFKRTILQQGLSKYREAVLDYMEYERLIGADNLGEGFFALRYEAAMACKMYQQALGDADRLIRLSPNNCVYKNNKAYVLLIAREFDQAITLAQTAIGLCPENSDAYRILGIAYGEKGNKSEAVTALKKAKALGDDGIDTLLKKYK